MRYAAKRDKTERDIVDALRGIGAQVFRLHTARPGVPDLVVVWRGRTVFMEVKAPGGRLSPAQCETCAAIEAAGGQVAVVRSVDEALHALQCVEQ